MGAHFGGALGLRGAADELAARKQRADEQRETEAPVASLDDAALRERQSEAIGRRVTAQMTLDHYRQARLATKDRLTAAQAKLAELQKARDEALRKEVTRAAEEKAVASRVAEIDAALNPHGLRQRLSMRGQRRQAFQAELDSIARSTPGAFDPPARRERRHRSAVATIEQRFMADRAELHRTITTATAEITELDQAIPGARDALVERKAELKEIHQEIQRRNPPKAASQQPRLGLRSPAAPAWQQRPEGPRQGGPRLGM
ncbi:MAG: hypothetical protein M0Z87_05035 [Actinomycetota bacterium]|nr:hypothetical protein [Actinomycetota bacterium]